MLTASSPRVMEKPLDLGIHSQSRICGKAHIIVRDCCDQLDQRQHKACNDHPVWLVFEKVARSPRENSFPWKYSKAYTPDQRK